MKNLKNLGKALSKAEQKEVNGGRPVWCGYCQCTGGPWPTVVFTCGNGSNVCRDACNGLA
ncbi:hypothetical protein [Lacinutrix himadriensis]|uniref:hypothetical protein n=1 Tax=Lacinutrix himadriensis TaxID=641549 RepID=UPI0006E32C9B|nr:hypothetical protein [Lacinutrix himadriensis]